MKIKDQELSDKIQAKVRSLRQLIDGVGNRQIRHSMDEHLCRVFLLARDGHTDNINGGSKAGTTTNLEGWQVSTCDEYLYATHTGAPGQIHIKAEAEGFVVDIWSSGDEPVCVATTSAMYSELEPE